MTEEQMDDMGSQLARTMERGAVGVTAVEPSLASTYDEDPVQHGTLTANLYQGASELAVIKGEMGVLRRPIDPATVEIRPDGIVYLPWIHISRIMQEAFKLSWSMVPGADPQVQGNEIIWYHHLYVRGSYVGSAYGQCNYSARNRGMTYGDAVEGAHSDALRRCAKRLGVATELWDPRWIKEWKNRFACKDNYGKWIKRDTPEFRIVIEQNGRDDWKDSPPPARALDYSNTPTTQDDQDAAVRAACLRDRTKEENPKNKDDKFALCYIREDGPDWARICTSEGKAELIPLRYLDALKNTEARGIMRKLLRNGCSEKLRLRISEVIDVRNGDKDSVRTLKAQLKERMKDAGITKQKFQRLTLETLSAGEFKSFPELDKSTQEQMQKMIDRFCLEESQWVELHKED